LKLICYGGIEMAINKREWDQGTNVRYKYKRLEYFLSDLSKKAANEGISVYVTSGYRSAKDQARVVCNNMVNTSGSNLSIYGPTTQDMYRTYCPHDMETLENYEQNKLIQAVARDPNYQGHGTGWSLDLRVINLTNDQKLKYKKIIESLGAEVLWEKHPEHFHVWLGDWKPRRRRAIIGGSMFLALAIGLLIFSKIKS